MNRRELRPVDAELAPEPRRFVVLESPGTAERLSDVGLGERQHVRYASCSFGVMVCGNRRTSPIAVQRMAGGFVRSVFTASS